MPYEWVDNEVALEHEGVKVYHVYKNDWMSEGQRDNNFSMEAGGNEETSFDVEELNKLLETPVKAGRKNRNSFAEDVLRAAIDQGLLTDGMDDDDVFELISDREVMA